MAVTKEAAKKVVDFIRRHEVMAKPDREKNVFVEKLNRTVDGYRYGIYIVIAKMIFVDNGSRHLITLDTAVEADAVVFLLDYLAGPPVRKTTTRKKTNARSKTTKSKRRNT